MAEPTQFSFSYKEVAEVLVKQQNLHEGIWSLNLKFGFQATNFGPNQTDLKPTAIVPVMEIGLQRVDQESSLTVDAAKVNPRPKSKHN